MLVCICAKLYKNADGIFKQKVFLFAQFVKITPKTSIKKRNIHRNNRNQIKTALIINNSLAIYSYMYKLICIWTTKSVDDVHRDIFPWKWQGNFPNIFNEPRPCWESTNSHWFNKNKNWKKINSTIENIQYEET